MTMWASSYDIEIEAERRARPAKRLGRALRRLEWDEALDLPADLLGALPLPPRIVVHVAGVPGLVAIELAGRSSARDGGDITIDAEEWLAIVRGAEADRLWPVDLAALCHRKIAEPAFRIDEETALAGAQPDPRERWTAREVLARIGAEVISIDLE